jgi:hypothetical protein
LSVPSLAAAQSLDDFSITSDAAHALATRSLVSAQSAAVSVANGPEQMINDP